MGKTVKKSWKCPDCGRQFRNANQWHSCQRVSPADHLRGKPDVIQSTYKALVRVLEGVEVQAVKTEILFRHDAVAFVAVTLRKKSLSVNLALPYRLESSRIYRSERISARKYWHEIRISDPAEVDEELKEWMMTARDEAGAQV